MAQDTRCDNSPLSALGLQWGFTHTPIKSKRSNPYQRRKNTGDTIYCIGQYDCFNKGAEIERGETLLTRAAVNPFYLLECVELQQRKLALPKPHKYNSLLWNTGSIAQVWLKYCGTICRQTLIQTLGRYKHDNHTRTVSSCQVLSSLLFQIQWNACWAVSWSSLTSVLAFLGPSPALLSQRRMLVPTYPLQPTSTGK